MEIFVAVIVTVVVGDLVLHCCMVFVGDLFGIQFW